LKSRAYSLENISNFTQYWQVSQQSQKIIANASQNKFGDIL